MKTWKIPVTWEMYGTVEIKANTLEEAFELAEDDSIPLPDGDYVNASWKVDSEDEDFVREYYNDNQEDEEEC